MRGPNCLSRRFLYFSAALAVCLSFPSSAHAQRAGRCERAFAQVFSPVVRPEEKNPEYAQQPYENLPTEKLWERVRGLLNQPVSDMWGPYIEAKLEEIDNGRWLPWWKVQKIAKGEHVPGVRLSKAAKNRLVENHNLIEKEREGVSNTISRPNTDGSGQAKNSWQKANELVLGWVADGVPISVERIAELHSILYDQEQLQADRRMAARSIAQLQQRRAELGLAMGFGWFNPLIGFAALEGYNQLAEAVVVDPSQIQSGVYRTYVVSAGGRKLAEYIDAKDVPRAMEELVVMINHSMKDTHPIVVGAQAYRWLVSIHPFRNANGRLGRLVLDWILLSNGYPPASFEGKEHEVAVHGRLDNIASPSTGKAIANVVDAVARSAQHLNLQATRSTSGAVAEPR